jgi:DNA-binding beta-propeller fold protein YncE/tRNA A-37 threonylcarbamoyl transferase component Bud32
LTLLTDSRIGSELAGYRLEALLGRGGMSVVYRAEHLRLKRKVALKLLAPELAEDERFRQRFLRESELAASLDHPNIVPVYDAGEVEGLLYIAMRYVEGSDLKALLRREGALERGRALALVAQVGDALDAAHDRGLVHRDVKPSNVLITGRAGREHCYLADFGLTKSASDRSDLTDSGQMMGTIDYVAPEQIQGGAVDGRADVYSLACLLYQCLAGEVPFKRDTDVGVIYAHLEDDAPKVSERRPEVPPALDAVLAKGMAKLRDERWDTCGALVGAARSAMGEPHTAPAPTPPRAAWRKRSLLIAGVAAVLVGASAVSILLRGGEAAVARADSLVRIDPASAKAVAGLEVSGRPSSITVCASSVFAASRDGTVSEIDPKTSTVYPIHVGGAPADISNVGNLAAVVAGPPKDTVTIIDAAYGGISGVVALPGAPSASATVAGYGRDVWIANPNAHELERLEPPYTGIAGTIPLPDRPTKQRRTAGYAGIAAGEGALWVAGDDAERVLWRVDPATRRVTAIRLPFAPRAVAAGYGGVWVVDQRGAVVRVDPKTNALGPRIAVGRGPRAVAVGAGFVWVANELSGTVSRIDPQRDAVDRTIDVGPKPMDLAVGLGALWVVRQAA